MWLTNTKTGKPFNTDWLDKDRQIEYSNEEAQMASAGETIPDEFNGRFGAKTIVDSVPGKIKILKENTTINPHYTEDKKYRNNCALCTTATIMQCRGYDVEADFQGEHWREPADVLQVDFTNANNYMLDSSSNPFMDERPVKAYISRQGIDPSSVNINKAPRGAEKNIVKVTELVESWGDGAYGELSITWKNGSSHSLFIYNDNGVAKIFDSQSNVTRGSKDSYKNLGFLVDCKGNNTMLLRFDNAKFKDMAGDKLMNMVKRRNK